MEIIDKYGSHFVSADYFTRGDHIENDHIHLGWTRTTSRPTQSF